MILKDKTFSNLNIIKPSHVEYRYNKALLIWPEIPFWMVCDKEVSKVFEIIKPNDNEQQLFMKLNRLLPDNSISIEELQKFLKHLKEVGLIEDLPSESLKDDTPIDLIENVTINITNKCNLNCITCYNQPMEHGKDQITSQEVDFLLNSLKDIIKKGSTFAVLGGEPLLRAEETINSCIISKKYGMKPIISTNGTLITDKIAKKLKRYSIELQISLDGATKETNDSIRGKGVFEKIRKSVKICRKRKVHTILSMVVCNRNFSELESFLKLGEDWKVNEVRFIPMKRIGKGKSEDLKVPPLSELVKRTAKFIEQNRNLQKYLLRDYFTILAMQVSACKVRNYCGAGLKTIFLDADGNLYPCPNHCYEEFKFGNIFNINIDQKDTWLNSPILNQLRAIYNIHELNRQCSKCIFKNWCTGGCRGEAYTVSGKLNAPSPDCNETRKAVIEMMWTLGEQPYLKPFKAKEEHF